MNYLTKLVLSKVSASELYDFIMEDARVFSSIRYDIIYRISGSFVFLYKKRRSDDSILCFKVFHQSESYVYGKLSYGDSTSDNSEGDNMMLSSDIFSNQKIIVSLLDKDYVLNSLLHQDETSMRCSSVATSVTMLKSHDAFIDSIEKMGGLVNNAAFNAFYSCITPTGRIKLHYGISEDKRGKKISVPYSIYAFVSDVKEEGFKIGNTSFGPWKIFTILTPFFGKMDVLLTDMGTDIDIMSLNYAVFTISETILDSLPLYSDSYKRNFPNYTRVIDDAISQRTDGRVLKDMLNKNATLYFNGILVGKGKEDVYSTIMSARRSIVDRSLYNRTITGKIIDIYGSSKDIIDYLLNARIKDKFNSFLKALKKQLINKHKQKYFLSDNKLSTLYYKKFIGTDVIMVVSNATQKITACIFAECKDGELKEIHISSLPIFDIDRTDNPLPPPSSTILYPRSMDLIRNTQPYTDITTDFLLQITPIPSKINHLLSSINQTDSKYLDLLISSVFLYLKNYVVNENSDDFEFINRKLTDNIFNSIRITDSIIYPYYDLFTYFGSFVPEVMFDLGIKIAREGSCINNLTASEIAKTVKDKVHSIFPKIGIPFSDHYDYDIFLCYFEMTRFIPGNAEKFIQVMTNISKVFLLYGICLNISEDASFVFPSFIKD